jgi:outer membrane receptor for ferrienterochelin and colicins
MRETDKFSAFFSAQGVNRDSYYGANQDLSAYGETEDFTFSSGIQYNRQIENLIFAPATLTSGLEYNGSFLEDKKLGYYDPVEDVHHGNTLVADQKVITRAMFLQSEWKINKWTITTGIRYDHYKVSDDTKESDDITGNVFSPRISLLYNITGNLQFRAGFARGFRAPQIFDEDLHIETSGSRQVLHQNNPGLKQESSNSFTASLDYSDRFGEWQIQFLAEGFYTRLSDPFANEYGTPGENGVVIYTRVNAEDGATVKGFNFELNASPSEKFQLQSGFTVQKSEFDEPQEFNETQFFRSPESYGYMSLNYNPAHEISVSFTGNYSGPMPVPYFGPLAANPEIGELHTSDSFVDAGLKITYEIHLSDIMSMQIIGGVKNIFNSYQDDFDTGVDRDPAYIYGPMSPRTIYFGIKIGNFI